LSPVQGPSQPVKTLPAVGVAVNVTDVAFGMASTQVRPQSIAPTLLVTVPEPLPDFAIVTVPAIAGATSNAHVASTQGTRCSALIVVSPCC
jgi:hypothetical protein